MASIVVRRYEANKQRTAHDWKMHETEAGQLERELWAALWDARREPEKFDDRDPEVWFGDTCVARLSHAAEIRPFVRFVMAKCAARV
jgi:hypothetical protein